mmetsp:Transcript_9155/g.13693  ORF Transcript_9155/g.13693 Transcript_9155/m.13693 type:complete len:233 (+) Transcript_9155:164-862(+)
MTQAVTLATRHTTFIITLIPVTQSDPFTMVRSLETMLPKITPPTKKKKNKHRRSTKKKKIAGSLIIELRYFQSIETDGSNDDDSSFSSRSSSSDDEGDDSGSEELSSSSSYDEEVEFRRRIHYLEKIDCGQIQIKRAVVPVPSSYIELQGHFAISFPQHDALLMVEREDGSQILPHETNFEQNEVIIFREFQPFSRREEAQIYTKGIAANWEQQDYLPSIQNSRTTMHKINS